MKKITSLFYILLAIGLCLLQSQIDYLASLLSTVMYRGLWSLFVLIFVVIPSIVYLVKGENDERY